VLNVLAPSLVLVLLRSPFGRSIASFPEPLRSLELLDGWAMARRKQPSTRRMMQQQSSRMKKKKTTKNTPQLTQVGDAATLLRFCSPGLCGPWNYLAEE
jgi:hypothetical protein